MDLYLIVTITSPDRPGIVDAISDAVIAHGANWETSRMVRLGGVFAGIIQLKVDRSRADELRNTLSGLSDENTTVLVNASDQADPYEGFLPLKLMLTSADHEGIVHSFAHFLAEQGVNVDELDTSVSNAPLGGGPLFNAVFDLKCPPGLDFAALEEKLQDLASSEAVDVKLEKKVTK